MINRLLKTCSAFSADPNYKGDQRPRTAQGRWTGKAIKPGKITKTTDKSPRISGVARTSMLLLYIEKTNL
jgi:hypothetical protein